MKNKNKEKNKKILKNKRTSLGEDIKILLI